MIFFFSGCDAMLERGAIPLSPFLRAKALYDLNVASLLPVDS